ncbi:hypothetical protein FPQ18DRAFT_354992 [Pyronema domesticum]|nr:hypothetical protein FPQ18DRAFT_354992 [Pyronema domesticum]
MIAAVGPMPFCVYRDQDLPYTDADAKNDAMCVCTDKIYAREIFKCVYNTCDQAMTNQFWSEWYSDCNDGGIQFPTPQRFLQAVGLNLAADKKVPTSVSVSVESGVYTTNTIYPANKATTYFSADQWPTEASVLATATLTNDDGAVYFTGTGAPTSTPTSGTEKASAATPTATSSANASSVPNAGMKLSCGSASVAGAAVIIAGVIALV